MVEKFRIMVAQGMWNQEIEWEWTGEESFLG